MIPNLFYEVAIPRNIPKPMEDKIKELSKIDNKGEFVKACFFHLIKKYKANRFCVLGKLNKLYQTDVKKLWDHEGFFYCMSLNYLLRIMLVKSGRFEEKDVQTKLTTTWYIVPHQYLKVKISEDQYITLDPFAFPFGIEYGDYAHGFHTGSFTPKK